MNNSYNQIKHCVNIFSADSTGCNWYRNYCPQLTAEHSNKNLMFNVCKKFNTDIKFFEDVNVNILQRQASDAQCSYYLNFVLPMSRKCGSWIVYNIDDCIHKDDIPKYNNTWETFQSDGLMDNIKRMIQSSNFVLVTTNELGQYYIDKFGADKNSIVVIPNRVPYWWMGSLFNLDKVMNNYETHVLKNKKPRIGIIGSTSHYDVNRKSIRNDISDVLPYIRKTTKKFKWVIFGGIIPELIDLIKSGDIEFHEGVDILHYPDVLSKLELQYIIAPLQDNIFNRCKSNIKLLEAWSLGIGCAGQDICTYNKYTDDVFSNNDSLDELLTKDLSSYDIFENKIKSNILTMNSLWLENNMHDWEMLYTMRKKPLVFNYDNIISGIKK